MKLILSIILAILFLLCILYVSFQELYDVNRTQKSEIEWLLKRNQELERENKTLRMALDSAKIKYK